MPRAPPKGRVPSTKKQTDAMEDPPLPADKGKEKVVEEDAAVTIHTEGSSSGLSLEEKLAALTSAHADADDFTDDDSDDELEFDVTKDLVAKQRFTAILLIPFILQQEMANVILTVRMLEEWICTQLSCGKAHGKLFVAAAEHITSARHLHGQEEIGAVTRATLGTVNLKGIRKEYEI
ncbi:unnamed protein product [Closterium sp. NIES-64]|nr:unnamed protein product [Closterium sp. NIES-64]CAI5961320.1 unnamed protein product [Closterium sp. NIES-64]